MNQEKTLIETTGYIKKQVNLTTVENNIIPNTLVLESLHPFPGYHGANLPERTSPRSLFLILNKECSTENLARITKKIKIDFNYDFNASQGNIYTKTATYSCIRIKFLQSFTFLPELMRRYQDAGIKFAKHKQITTSGLIVINKSFFVDNLEQGIYKDYYENSKFYIELPTDLPWDEFVEMTKHIKNNIENSNFDAAQGVFYRKDGIVEVIRLYICEGEYEKVKHIQQMYIDLINKR